MDHFIKEAEMMKFFISLTQLTIFRLMVPHPNVVLFRGVCLPPDPFCIVLEYCPGGSLYDYLKSHREINISLKLKWAKETARGMVIEFFSLLIRSFTCTLEKRACRLFIVIWQLETSWYGSK